MAPFGVGRGVPPRGPPFRPLRGIILRPATGADVGVARVAALFPRRRVPDAPAGLRLAAGVTADPSPSRAGRPGLAVAGLARPVGPPETTGHRGPFPAARGLRPAPAAVGKRPKAVPDDPPRLFLGLGPRRRLGGPGDHGPTPDVTGERPVTLARVGGAGEVTPDATTRRPGVAHLAKGAPSVDEAATFCRQEMRPSGGTPVTRVETCRATGRLAPVVTA